MEVANTEVRIINNLIKMSKSNATTFTYGQAKGYEEAIENCQHCCNWSSIYKTKEIWSCLALSLSLYPFSMDDIKEVPTSHWNFQPLGMWANTFLFIIHYAILGISRAENRETSNSRVKFANIVISDSLFYYCFSFCKREGQIKSAKIWKFSQNVISNPMVVQIA